MSSPIQAPPVPPPVHRPPTADIGLMAVGVLAVSTSGPLMAALVVPALAVAMWRNVLALAVILPVAALRRRHELRAISRREWRWALLAGLMLAAHFATWVPSVRFTSVTSATALVCTQPVWVALVARLTGHHVPRRTWAGMAIALLGVLLLTGVDFSLEPRALIGDGLALLGGLFAALYTIAGAEVRRTVSTTSYTAICYSTAALILLAVCLAVGVPLWAYDAISWWQLAALTLGPQLLGHSVVNVVLKTTSPTVVSLVLLLEVPGAAVLAAVWLGQLPPLAALPAAALLLVGLGLVVSQRTPGVQPAIPAE